MRRCVTKYSLTSWGWHSITNGEFRALRVTVILLIAGPFNGMARRRQSSLDVKSVVDKVENVKIGDKLAQKAIAFVKEYRGFLLIFDYTLGRTEMP